VYRQVSILSQGRNIPVRKAATKEPVAAVVAFVTPRPELWSGPVFFSARENPHSLLEPCGLWLSTIDLGADPSPQPRALLPAGQGLRWRDLTANSQNARAASDTGHRCERRCLVYKLG
jgi:hypothetical protein